jgi:hypothetical protein
MKGQSVPRAWNGKENSIIRKMGGKNLDDGWK